MSAAFPDHWVFGVDWSFVREHAPNRLAGFHPGRLAIKGMFASFMLRSVGSRCHGTAEH